MKIIVFKYGEALYPEYRLFADRSGDQKIPMAFCFYLIQTEGKNILVDTGCAGQEKYGFYAYKHPVELLAEYGLKPEDITDVILTHCHFDHVEGISFFRDAVIHVQKNEYDLRGAAYIGMPEKLVLFEEEDTVAEGVRVCRYGGHPLRVSPAPPRPQKGIRRYGWRCVPSHEGTLGAGSIPSPFGG